MNDLQVKEAETAAYKAFMKPAKKVVKLDPSFKIVPDLKEPFRIFTLQKDLGWCTVKIGLFPEQYERRNSPNRSVKAGEDRGMRYKLALFGLFNDRSGEIAMKTGLTMKPRIQKKIVDMVNNRVGPGFYKEVEATKKAWEEKHAAVTQFQSNVLSVKGLQIHKGNNYETKNRFFASFKESQEKIRFELKQNEVELHGVLSYPELQQLADAMGWGKL